MIRNGRQFTGVWFTVVCCACLFGLLSACSLSNSINRQVFDYFRANDLASNQIIFLNILYAHDGAPLHFSELSQIRGQLTATATASSTVPFGPIDHATVNPRDLVAAGITVGSAPTFDIASLDTKDFTTGVMTPITPRSVEFFMNNGIDYRMVLILLVSAVRPAGSQEMLLNAPSSSRKVCIDEPHQFGSNAPLKSYKIVSANEQCVTHMREFYAFLDVLNQLSRVYPVSVIRPPRPVGPPFNLTMNINLRAITGIDPERYTLRRLPSGQYQLMTAKKQKIIVLCEETSTVPQVVSALADDGDVPIKVDKDACSKRRSYDEDDTAPPVLAPDQTVTIGQTPGTFAIRLRSTLEVIQYVGQLLAYQEAATAKHKDRPERCATLQFIKYDTSNATCDGAVLFRTQSDFGPTTPSALSVQYNGRQWSLAPPHICAEPEHCDYSLQTMAMISLLLNENKSAKDIPTTPAVQVVP